MVAYLFLFIAIFAEVAATSLLKSTEGFSRLWPTAVCLLGYAVSFACDPATFDAEYASVKPVVESLKWSKSTP